MKFEYAKLVGYMGIYQGTLRREVEIDKEKSKKRNMKHCTKSKFCAKRNRSKI